MTDYTVTTPDGQDIPVSVPEGKTKLDAARYVKHLYDRRQLPYQKTKFPYDRPGMEYGTYTPLAYDTKTGKSYLAFPEAIRAPVRGAIEFGRGIMGKSEQDPTSPEFRETPEELSAVMTMGGMRPSPGVQTRAAPPPVVKPGAKEAHEAGFVLMPPMASKHPGIAAKTTAGWAGKLKTQQHMSERNQENVNALVRSEWGLPADTMLDAKTFAGMKSTANQAYAAIPAAMPTTLADGGFASDIVSIGGRTAQAEKEFPELTNNPEVQTLKQVLAVKGSFSTESGIQMVRQLRFQATQNLKSIGSPEKVDLALSQRAAADAIDDLIERNFDYQGKPNLVPQYRQARTLLAQVADVEAATNEATGDVSSIKLAQLQAHGRPFTGNLKTIADTATSFRKVMQSPSRFGGTEEFSTGDIAAIGLGAALHDPSLLEYAVGKPLARRAAMSGPVQSRMVREPPAPAAASIGAARALGGAFQQPAAAALTPAPFETPAEKKFYSQPGAF